MRVNLVTAPHAGNSYIAAQQGLFTVLQWDPSRQVDQFPALEELISGDVTGMTDAVLTKISLPAFQVPLLALGLVNHGYNAARIFPGLSTGGWKALFYVCSPLPLTVYIFGLSLWEFIEHICSLISSEAVLFDG